MKVKPSALAIMLGMTPSSITMAVGRDSLNKTVAGLIDTDDLKNRDWITRRLAKQGREIPQDFCALFKATPVTENEKSESNNSSNKTPEPPGQPAAQGGQQPLPQGQQAAPEGVQEGIGDAEVDAEAQAKVDKQISQNALKLDTAKADKAFADARLAETKAANERRELIEINPLARLLFGVVAAQRTQSFNAIPNISSFMLDDIQSAWDSGKSRTEILMQIQKTWQDELSVIYKAIDKELTYRVKKAKRHELTSEGLESAA